MKFKGLDQDPSKILESLTVKPHISLESGKAFKESSSSNSSFLLPRIEAIHVGETRNSTYYPADKLLGSEELKSGVYSWTHPYPKPVIFNHDVETQVTGRVQTAMYSEYTNSGMPGIVVVPKITSPEAIKDIVEGRLLTVSIGATTDAAICSICGTDIISEGFCGHEKGQEYNGRNANWIAGNLWFDELSWVTVPSDQSAMIVDAGEIITLAESYGYNGRDIVNLGTTTDKWIVGEKTIEDKLGYSLSEGDKGKKKEDLDLITKEELEKLQKDLKEASEKCEELSKENESILADKEKAEAELVEKEEALTAKEEEVKEAKETLEAEEAKVQKLEKTVSEKTEEVKALEEEKSQLLSENTDMAQKVSESIIDRITDQTVALGKGTDREEIKKRYEGRTTESLKYALEDLLHESNIQVERPGVTFPAGSGVVKEKQKDEKLGVQDALMGLFRGPGSRQ